MNEVAVVERLQAQVGELEVALGLEGATEAVDVETFEFGGQELEFGTLVDERGKRAAIDVRHLGLRCLGHATLGAVNLDAQKGQRLGTEFVEQETSRHVGVVGFHFDQRAGGDEQAGGNVLGGDAVVHVAEGFFDDAFRIDVVEPLAGFHDQRADARDVQRQPAAVGGDHVDAARRCRGFGRFGVGRTNPGSLLAVQHVVAGDLVLASPHQGELHQILYLLDVDGAAGGHAPLVGAGHLLRQLRDDVPDAGRRRGGASLDRQKRLGERHLDLVVVVGDHRTVALDHAELSRSGCHDGWGGRRDRGGRRNVLRRVGSSRGSWRIRLHGHSFSLVTLRLVTGYPSSTLAPTTVFRNSPTLQQTKGQAV